MSCDECEIKGIAPPELAVVIGNAPGPSYMTERIVETHGAFK